MKRALLLMLLPMYLPPSLFAQEGGQYYEITGEKALRNIKWDWQAVLNNWKIIFLPSMPGYLGMATPNERLIEIWVRFGLKPYQIAGVIAHELAHAVDSERLTPAQRAEWYRVRGISAKTPWYPPPNLSDYRYGAGDFAECMSHTLQGPVLKFRSKLGPPPTQAQRRLIRQWLAQITTAGK